jgi:hypothetical protein
MKTVQDFYPETVHQIIVLNAPSTFSQIFTIFSAILNDRMKAKIIVTPVAVPFAQICEPLAPRGVHAWLSFVTKKRCEQAKVEKEEEFTIDAGRRCMMSWLFDGTGGSFSWQLTMNSKDCNYQVLFLPLEPEADAVVIEAEGLVTAAECVEGTTDIRRPGVVVMLLDNAAAWLSSKVVAGQFTANGGVTA